MAEAGRALTAQLEAEREKRVAAVQQQALRRIQQIGLSKGWSAWHELWEERVRQRNMLRQAGARLTRPALACTFHEWRDDYQEEARARIAAALEAKHKQEMEEQEAKAREMGDELQKARLETARVELLKVALEDERKALKERMKDDKERMKAVLREQEAELKELRESSAAAVSAAQAKREDTDAIATRRDRSDDDR